MAFFFLLIMIWCVLWLLSRFPKFNILKSLKYKSSLAFSIGFFVIGISHLAKPEALAYMVPSFVPYARNIIIITGFLEIILATLLQINKIRKYVAWIIIIYLIAIFPANINVAVHHLSPPGGLPSENWYIWSRLLFQPVYIAWVYYSSIKSDK